MPTVRPTLMAYRKTIFQDVVFVTGSPASEVSVVGRYGKRNSKRPEGGRTNRDSHLHVPQRTPPKPWVEAETASRDGADWCDQYNQVTTLHKHHRNTISDLKEVAHKRVCMSHGQDLG